MAASTASCWAPKGCRARGPLEASNTDHSHRSSEDRRRRGQRANNADESAPLILCAENLTTGVVVVRSAQGGA
jgi:hypothetical protein